jgi:hypothetical protein
MLLESKITSFMSGLQPETPEQAVELWILGVKNRSGAVQFSLLSPSLQNQTREQFELRGWHTGQSSPWVDYAWIVKVNKVSPSKFQYAVVYDLINSFSNFGRGQKFITVEKNEESYKPTWFITEIVTTNNPYEAFTPAETVLK